MSEHIVQRRIKHQKLRRQARRSSILVRRLYKIFRFLFVIFIFYAVYRLAATNQWYLDRDLANIEIIGNKIIKNEQIINEIKKIEFQKEPIYRINPIANQIQTLKPIKRAYVRRFWFPARLLVMVEEVNPAIMIAPAENTPVIVAFAYTGEMISRDFLPLEDTTRVVKILTYGTQGDDYESWDAKKIQELYSLYQLIEEYAGEKVQYIDLRIPHNAFVQLESVKIKLGELDPSVYERIKSIHNILPEIKELTITEQIKYIDLSWKDSKYLKME